MSTNWWNSLDRIDRIFRASLNVMIVAFTIAAVCWLVPVRVVAIAASIVGTTAALLTLFSWFRRDDLARSMRPRP